MTTVGPQCLCCLVLLPLAVAVPPVTGAQSLLAYATCSPTDPCSSGEAEKCAEPLPAEHCD